MTKAKKKSYAALVRENRALAQELDKWQALSETQDRFIQGLTLKAHGETIVLNRITREVWSFDEPVALTPTAFTLLEQLMLHQGEVLTPEALSSSLWRPDEMPKSNMLPVVMHHLRKALGPAGELVKVVRGGGHGARAQGYTIAKLEPA